jgi:hypothetical protein
MSHTQSHGDTDPVSQHRASHHKHVQGTHFSAGARWSEEPVLMGQRDSALNAQNHGEGAFDLAHRVGRQHSQSFQHAAAGDSAHAAADGDAGGIHTFVR